MFPCPNCRATLPEGTVRCQFCGAAIAAPPSPGRRQAAQTSSGFAARPNWVLPVYYAIAGWWILNGLYDVLMPLLSSHGGTLGIIGMLIGAVTALVGLGLILKIEAARGIVNILCFLQILDGGLGLIFSFVLSLFSLWGVIGMIFSIFRIAFACLMIYLLSETETRGPNF